MRSGRAPYKLDQLGFVGRGKSKHRPRNDPSLYGGEYPFFQTGDVKGAELYLRNYSSTYNEKGLAQSKLWQPGTLCVTIAANIADTSILSVPGCFPDSVVGFVADPQKSNVFFVKYYLDTLKNAMQSISHGTTQDNLSLEKLLSFDFLVPSVGEQQKIASVLLAYDDLIENNTRRIEILEEMARRLYEEWFVQFRFPGHEEAGFKESELGLIPEGWGVAAVTDAFTIKYGKTFPKTMLNPEGQYPVFGGGGMIGRCDQFNIQGPTALITSRGNGSGTVWRVSEAGLVTNNAFIVMPKEARPNVHYGYIEQALLNAPVKSFLGGAAQPQLTLDGLAGVRLLTPDPKVVQQFSALVDPFYALISRIERASANLRAQRDLLLPKLISGEIDVSDIPMPT